MAISCEFGVKREGEAVMDNMMKAAVLHAPGCLQIEDVPVPVPGKNEVLVKVLACGVCGSDIPRIVKTGTYHFPTIPGHEFGGMVCRTGSEEYQYLVGKKVAVNPLIPCYECEMCEVGKFAQCKQYDFLGSRSHGGFAQYAKVPVKNLIVMPDQLDDKATAFLEPVTVALHVVQNCQLRFGENVAVFGLGAIGMFIAQWAKAFGAAHVFAIDIDEKKVALAKAVGLDEAICSGQEDIEKTIGEKTGGVEFVFEASGSEIAFSQAIHILRQSGTLGLVGRPTRNLSVAPQVFEKILRSQLTIKGTWSFESVNFPHNAWKQSTAAIDKGQIQISQLISHCFSLERTMEAIELMAKQKEFYSKILIIPND